VNPIQQEPETLDRQNRLVNLLAEAERSRRPHSGVELIETHISWILLAGRFAYKIKKAVHLDFIDASDLEVRRFFCEEELRLNRRLAPRLYLDVVPIGGSEDAPELERSPALEYAVRMSRFDTADEMDRMVLNGTLLAQHIDSLAVTLARFHRNLPAAAEGVRYGNPSDVYVCASQNLAQVRALLPEAEPVLAGLEQNTETAFARNKNNFNRRCTEGFVRECHGDLHLANIVVMDGEAVPFDGIDFDPALRWIDVIADMAFPFMDLLHYERPGLAYRLINRYLEESGDYGAMGMFLFHASARAVVRAKVYAIRTSQQKPDSHERSRFAAVSLNYISLAAVLLVKTRPFLVITHGLPGSGKSTFAQAALERFGAIRIRSDIERKRLFGLSALDVSHSQPVDIYSTEATERTYRALRRIAHELLSAGFSVIVDAAFLRQAERRLFREMAEKEHVPFAIASVLAGEALLRKRILERMSKADDPSEANLDVLAVLQTAGEALTSSERSRLAEFHNDAENGFAADDPGWKSLDDLLA